MRTLEEIWADLCRAERISIPMAHVERLRSEAATALLGTIVAPQVQAA